MNWIVRGLDVAWGLLCIIGWVVGVLAWARRGFGIPRAVHIAAVVLFVIGVLAAILAASIGIRSLGFTAFALVGFPLWAYLGWLFFGCPPARQHRQGGYDISQALTRGKK